VYHHGFQPPTMHDQDVELFTRRAGLSGLTLKTVNNAIDKKDGRRSHRTKGRAHYAPTDKSAINLSLPPNPACRMLPQEFRRRVLPRSRQRRCAICIGRSPEA